MLFGYLLEISDESHGREKNTFFFKDVAKLKSIISIIIVSPPGPTGTNESLAIARSVSWRAPASACA